MQALIDYIKENGVKSELELTSLTGKEYKNTVYTLPPNSLTLTLVILAKTLFTPTDGTKTPKYRIFPTQLSVLYCNRKGVGFYGYEYELIETEKII